MGLTKTEIFTDEQNKLAIQLKAIAHPRKDRYFAAHYQHQCLHLR